MKSNLFLKLEGQTNSKNKPNFLNTTFWIHFGFAKDKMGKNSVGGLTRPILHTFDTAYAEN